MVLLIISNELNGHVLEPNQCLSMEGEEKKNDEETSSGEWGV